VRKEEKQKREKKIKDNELVAFTDVLIKLFPCKP